eukprot:2245609-Karenia_brevis.AAC.1
MGREGKEEREGPRKGREGREGGREVWFCYSSGSNTDQITDKGVHPSLSIPSTQVETIEMCEPREASPSCQFHPRKWRKNY